jgi:hypothetical protein
MRVDSNGWCRVKCHKLRLHCGLPGLWAACNTIRRLVTWICSSNPADELKKVRRVRNSEHRTGRVVCSSHESANSTKAHVMTSRLSSRTATMAARSRPPPLPCPESSKLGPRRTLWLSRCLCLKKLPLLLLLERARGTTRPRWTPAACSLSSPAYHTASAYSSRDKGHGSSKLVHCSSLQGKLLKLICMIVSNF